MIIQSAQQQSQNSQNAQHSSGLASHSEFSNAHHILQNQRRLVPQAGTGGFRSQNLSPELSGQRMNKQQVAAVSTIASSSVQQHAMGANVLCIKRSNFERVVQRLDPIVSKNANPGGKSSSTKNSATKFLNSNEKTRAGYNQLGQPVSTVAGSFKPNYLKVPEISMSTSEGSSCGIKNEDGAAGRVFSFNKQQLAQQQILSHSGFNSEALNIQKRKHFIEDSVDINLMNNESMKYNNNGIEQSNNGDANQSFFNRVQRVTSVNKRKLKLRSMHDVSVINSSLGNIAFPQVIHKDKTGTHAGAATQNFNQFTQMMSEKYEAHQFHQQQNHQEFAQSGTFDRITLGKKPKANSSSVNSTRQSLNFGKNMRSSQEKGGLGLRIQIGSPEDLSKHQNMNFDVTHQFQNKAPHKKNKASYIQQIGANQYGIGGAPHRNEASSLDQKRGSGFSQINNATAINQIKQTGVYQRSHTTLAKQSTNLCSIQQMVSSIPYTQTLNAAIQQVNVQKQEDQIGCPSNSTTNESCEDSLKNILQDKNKQRRTLEQTVIFEVFCPTSNILENESIKEVDYQELFHSTPKKMSSNEILTVDKMDFHQISEENRARIIDWMVQVFRALKVSSYSTFFSAVTILDKYFLAKWQQQISLGPESLYLIGMTSILISSKLEDVEAIRMRTLLEKAGHGKFTQNQILETELDIYQSLSFKVLNAVNVINESTIIFAHMLQNSRIENLSTDPSTREVIQQSNQYLMFLCQLSTFDLGINSQPAELVASVIVHQTLQFMQRQLLFENILDEQEINDLIHCMSDACHKFVTSTNRAQSNAQQTELSKKLDSFYKLQLTESDGSMRNLEKSYPLFLGPEINVSPTCIQYLFERYMSAAHLTSPSKFCHTQKYSSNKVSMII